MEYRNGGIVQNKLCGVHSFRASATDLEQLDVLVAFYNEDASKVMRRLLRERCAAIAQNEEGAAVNRYNGTARKEGIFTRRGQ